MLEKKENVVVSLSGGLDSSTLLLKCLKEYNNITAVSFDYGQKHRVELEKAQSLVNYLNNYEGKYPKINYKVIRLEGLSELLTSGLVDNDSMELKTGHYAHENALTTVVPNRNAIFAAITYAVALSQVKKTNKPCDIALGTHMGDFNNEKKEGIYPDCSEDFRTALEHAFKIGNWDSDKVNYYAPFNDTDKTGVLKSGIELCGYFGFDYKEIYSRTHTSYIPVKIKYTTVDGNSVDAVASDFTNGSSIERIESFINLGYADPVQYAKTDGTLVSWEYVTEYVKKVVEEFNKNKQ